MARVEHAMRVEDLSRHFGTIRAVDHLSFEVPAGAVFGFLGPNGSGKTTTIRLLLGLLQPTAGRAEVLGLDTRSRSPEIRARVGALLEHDGLYEHMTALGNLDFWARAWRMGIEERSVRIRELLEHFGLWERRSDRVSSWSHGMKRRLALARALLTRPEVVILDEPTAGLDVASAAAVRENLAALAAGDRVTVFLSTHNMAEAEKLCTLLAVIRSGTLMALGSPGELRARAGRPRVEIVGRGFHTQLLETVRRQPYVAEVTAHGTRLSVEFHQATDPAPLVGLLVNEGASIEEVRRSAPSLEEVFLSLIEEERDRGEDQP